MATESHEERARIDDVVAAIRARDPRTPRILVVLGSGLGPFAGELLEATRIPYASLPHIPPATVVGHAGEFVIGRVPACADGKPGPLILAQAGRLHGYEGHSAQEVVRPLRAAIRLGAQACVLTNASGGIARDLTPGDLVLIRDHLNLQGRTPLQGPNDDALGPRFPDMSHAYDPVLREIARRAGHRTGVPLREGVYAALQGPSYETPAEIHMLRVLGADLVGMSTVPETIAARHMGARVLGIACVTNLAAGVSPTPLDHSEVEQVARAGRARFSKLLCAILGDLDTHLGASP